MKTLTLLAVAAGTGLLPAQTASLTALAPVTVRVNLNSQVQSNSVPAGLLANQQLATELGVSGSASHALSTMYWSYHASPWIIHMYLGHHAEVASATPASAEVVSCDLLLQLSNPTPILVQFSLRDWILAPAGVPAPILRIDVGNDGLFELTESGPVPMPALSQAVLGPTPLPVRVQYVAALSSPGEISNGLYIEVTPLSASFQDLTVGCDPTHFLSMAPTFDNGVAMYVTGAVPQEPAVIVLGLTSQPVILPSSQWLPCLLIPSPDALVLRLDDSIYTLPVPTAVRPIGFFVQPVIVRPTSLQTGNGKWVYAP